MNNPGHLPQLRAPGAVYFITWRLHDQADTLAASERSIVARNLEYFNEQRYRLTGYVVMDDHVHVMVMPLPGFELAQILHSWKSYTAKEINRLRGQSGTRWMKDSYTEIMRNEKETRTKLEYIIANPVRRWPAAKGYEWAKWFDVL